MVAEPNNACHLPSPLMCNMHFPNISYVVDQKSLAHGSHTQKWNPKTESAKFWLEKHVFWSVFSWKSQEKIVKTQPQKQKSLPLGGSNILLWQSTKQVD